MSAPGAPLLEVEGITAGYGRTTVLRDISFSVHAGQVTALLGGNGAGKTTLLRTLSGLLRPTSGKVALSGVDVTKLPAHRRAKAGLCLVPEGRGIFRNLTVRDNLRVQQPPWRRQERFEPAIEAFPILQERLHQTAGSLSGGQQQMLALSRTTLAAPALVLVDEVSMGLAPRTVDEIFKALRGLAAGGVALLIVEQYVERALDLADNVLLLTRGSLTFTGKSDQLDAAELTRSYLGDAQPAGPLDGQGTHTD